MEKPVLLVPLVMNYDKMAWTGGKTYIENLLRSLNALPEGERPDIFLALYAEGSEEFLENQIQLPCVAGVLDNRGLPLWLRQDILDDVMPGGAFALERMQAQLNRAVASFPVLYTLPGLQVPNPIYWIPDFQHQHLPDMFTPEELVARDDLYAKVVGVSGGRLLLSSQDALGDFKRFYPTAAITPFVWPFASALDPTAKPFTDPRTMFGLPKRYLYTPNQFWKHKNYETTFRALGILAERGIRPALVITGATEDHRNPTHFKDMMALAEALGIADQIRHLGVLPRSAQVDLFKAAQAVLQPSRFEGWSTVVEDARAVGCPLILSDLPIHREQMGAEAHYFPPLDPMALADLLESLLPELAPGPHPERETAAAEAGAARLVERGRALMEVLQAPVPRGRPLLHRPFAFSSDWAATPVEDGPNTLRVADGQYQWYAPVVASAESVATHMWSQDYVGKARDLNAAIAPDAYTTYLSAYMKAGQDRFGADWRFADIITVLMSLTDCLAPRDYLEIGVRQGRSACAVASRRPDIAMVLADMWGEGSYAGMENPGAAFALAQLAKVGHRGSTEVVQGDSHVVLPRWLVTHPDRQFDLITVDGDHSTLGAIADLETVLPRLRLGGAIVFDDISNPAHPDLPAVWHDLFQTDPRFSCWSFDDLGYGVAFAIRRG